MIKILSYALIIIFIAVVTGFAQQQGGMAGQGGADAQNGKQMMDPTTGTSLNGTGPGMSRNSGYSGMIDPRTMSAMIGYVMKPNMIKNFENDPGSLSVLSGSD